jgi:hypothetical protein
VIFLDHLAAGSLRSILWSLFASNGESGGVAAVDGMLSRSLILAAAVLGIMPLPCAATTIGSAC